MNVLTQFPSTHDANRGLPFQTVFEAAALGIAICQLDGRILEANPALSRMFGYSQKELSGKHADALRAQPSRETDSENPNPALSLDERSLRDLFCGERQSLQLEKRYRRKDGSELWGQVTLSLARDQRRRPAFLIAIIADATERKQVEDHLREAQKMEVIGRLAGGIAHDFNNLLTGILLYCDLLSAGLTPGNNPDSNGDSDGPKAKALELQGHVEEVRRAGEQGAAMTQQLLAIARKQSSQPRPLLLNDVVASTENLLRRLIGEQIELVVHSDPNLDAPSALVLADPPQMRQILLNLVLNARDAMPQGGKIQLSTHLSEFPQPSDENRNLYVSEPASENRFQLKHRPQSPAVVLRVSDNGCGMTQETRARLFEPFFTTKKPGHGTGLGLATVQRIVSESGGIIKVQSEPGKGTCVDVLFPPIESPLPESPAFESPKTDLPETDFPKNGFAKTDRRAQVASPLASPPNGKVRQTAKELSLRSSPKTILLVDDHAPARKSMRRLLLNAGYATLEAASAKQALRLFAEASPPPDLLVADCMLPGMNGHELAEKMLLQKPALKILLLSGFEDPPIGSAAYAVELIRKPFSGSTLIERVRAVMQNAAEQCDDAGSSYPI